MEEEDEFKFGMSNLLWDDDKEEEKSSNKLFVEEEFLKPSDLLYEEESKNNILPEKIIINETNEISPEIRYIKYKRQEPDEEYLFSPTKLLDDESKNVSDDDEYLFKPSEFSVLSQTQWHLVLVRLKKLLVAQLCLTLCNPVDCSLQGFSVHGVPRAIILEMVAILFSRISPTQGSNLGLLHCRQILYL